MSDELRLNKQSTFSRLFRNGLVMEELIRQVGAELAGSHRQQTTTSLERLCADMYEPSPAEVMRFIAEATREKLEQGRQTCKTEALLG